VGALATATLPFVLFFPHVRSGEDPRFDYAGYPIMGLTLGLTMSVAGLVATLSTLKWRSRLSRAPFNSAPGFWGVISSVAVALRNGSFRALFFSFTLIFLGTVISSTLALYFLIYYAGIVDSGALSAVQLSLYLGSFVGVLGWLRISKRLEKRSLYMLAAAATSLFMLGAFGLLGVGRLFGTGDVRPVLVGQVLAGVAFGVFWFLPASMLADVVDEDALATGRRREGIFFGTFSFGQQVATGVSVLVAGVLLEHVVGLVPGQAAQSSATVERIGMLSSLLPAALLAVGTVLILRYPLDRQRVLAIQRELADMAREPI
jgi:Na+/melibiose symporter-like transporter